MDRYVTVDGKQMRLGYTTGSCAAAASKAAAYMLLTGRALETVKLLTPKGIPLELPLHEVSFDKEKAVCAVEKDGGDDPDVTTGALIYAEVTYGDAPGVDIDGGVGVGRVTKPGLDQPVGNAAINSTPRRMIRENVEEVCRLMDYHGGLKVLISAPAGVELAKKTFNPRLGIQGGISILGTTGIVEPMSESALIETIRVELRQRRAEGAEYALLTPGNYGADFLKDSLQVDWKRAVLTSNFIGDSLDACREFGFRGALLVGHVGKLVKISGNMLNTHSKWGTAGWNSWPPTPGPRAWEAKTSPQCWTASAVTKPCASSGRRASGTRPWNGSQPRWPSTCATGRGRRWKSAPCCSPTSTASSARRPTPGR